MMSKQGLILPYLSSLIILLSITSMPALAGITVTGTSDPTYDSSDPWNLTDNLTLADSMDGTLTINGGSDVNVPVSLYIGNNASTVTGSLVVDGTGTTLVVGDDAYVARESLGSMTLSDGATFTVGDRFYGFDRGTLGDAATVTITGSNTLLDIGGYTHFGGYKTLNFTLSDGATMNVGGRLQFTNGGDDSSVTNVTITGAGTTLTVGDDFWAHERGTGTFTVADGATVTVVDRFSSAGGHSSAVTEFIVTGTDSLVTVGSLAMVGYRGQGIVTLLDGGTFHAGDFQLRSSNDILRGHNGTLISDSTFDNIGQISPGATDGAIGSLTITGDVEMESGGLLVIDTDGTNSDTLTVSGNFGVMHTGTYINVNTAVVGTYNIVDANSLSGNIETELPFLGYYLTEQPGAVLQLEIKTAADYDDPLLTDNRNRSGVGALMKYLNDTSQTSLPGYLTEENTQTIKDAYDSFAGLIQLAPARIASAALGSHLSTIAGEIRHGGRRKGRESMHGPLLSLGTPNLFNTASNNRFQQPPAVLGSRSQDETGDHWNAWIVGDRVRADRKKNNLNDAYKYQVTGIHLGADQQITEDWRIGLSGGWSEGNLYNNKTPTQSDSENIHGSLYFSHETDRGYIDGIANYTAHQFKTQRTVSFGSLNETNRAKFKGYSTGFYVEAGHNLVKKTSWSLQPLLGLNITSTRIDSYNETGQTTALAFETQKHQSLKGSLGGRFTRTLEHEDGYLNEFELRGRWAHEFGDTTSTSMASLQSVYYPFAITDGEMNRNSVLIGASYRAYNAAQNLQLGIDIDQYYNGDERAQRLALRFKYMY